MDAQAAIQCRIDAQQRLDTIEYGLRALKDRYAAGPAREAQVRAAMAEIDAPCWDNSLIWKLTQARRQAREEVAAAKAAVAAVGNVRQLRLALREEAA